MRTAEEYLKSKQPYTMPPSHFHEMYCKGDVIKLINEARKEAIEECASLCEIQDNNFHPTVTKENILSLINELK